MACRLPSQKLYILVLNKKEKINIKVEAYLKHNTVNFIFNQNNNLSLTLWVSFATFATCVDASSSHFASPITNTWKSAVISLIFLYSYSLLPLKVPLCSVWRHLNVVACYTCCTYHLCCRDLENMHSEWKFTIAVWSFP